jgi:hypothetical protein
MPGPIKLHRQNRFETIRQETGAIVADVTNPPTDASVEEWFADADMAPNVVLYWNGTNLGGADLDLEIWIRDGGPDTWKLGATAAGVLPNVLTVLPVYGATPFHVRVAAFSGTPAGLEIRAFVMED